MGMGSLITAAGYMILHLLIPFYSICRGFVLSFATAFSNTVLHILSKQYTC